MPKTGGVFLARLSRTTLSLGSTLIGWVVGFASYLGWMKLTAPGGRATDLDAMFVWPGFFILIGWALIFLPLVLILRPDHPALRPLRFAGLGALLGVAGFLLLVAWWTGFWRYALYPIYAASTGFTAGLIYALGNRILLRS